jgi:hypothetical protein
MNRVFALPQRRRHYNAKRVQSDRKFYNIQQEQYLDRRFICGIEEGRGEEDQKKLELEWEWECVDDASGRGGIYTGMRDELQG